jgi:hypothetical protein
VLYPLSYGRVWSAKLLVYRAFSCWSSWHTGGGPVGSAFATDFPRQPGVQPLNPKAEVAATIETHSAERASLRRSVNLFRPALHMPSNTRRSAFN